MATRYIYFPEDLHIRLKSEENVSGLIQQLLRVHYDSEKPKETKEDMLERIKEIGDEKIRIETEVKEIETIETQTEEERKAAEEAREKAEEKRMDSPEYWEGIRVIERGAFDKYQVPKEQAESLFEEFFTLLKEMKVKNLLEFMEDKGIKRKNGVQPPEGP